MKPSARFADRPAPRRATQIARLGLVLGVAITLAGCASDGTTTGVNSGAPGVGVYVIQNTTAAATSTTTATTSGSILEFSTASTGAATPISTLNGTTGAPLAFLAADATGDIYTTSQSSTASSVAEYTVGSTNNALPTRSIPFNATTQITAPTGLAVDPLGGIYLPEAAGGVAIFAPTATGSVAPGGYILGDSQPGGGLSTLSTASAAAADNNGNLYVVDTGTSVTNPIVVFSTTATGNIAPTRSIGGALTTMTVGSPQAIATDTAGNLYVANVVAGVSSILIFDPTATGNTPPLRDITGGNTQLGCVGGLALDSEGFLYVISTPTCGSTANPTILKFSTTGDGNIAPVSSFTSTAWTNADPTLSIAVF